MPDQPSPRLSIARVAFAGVITTATFFVLCWLGALLPVGPASHMCLRLFTAEQGATFAALLQGIRWSITFGLIAGGPFAFSCNALSWLERK